MKAWLAFLRLGAGSSRAREPRWLRMNSDQRFIALSEREVWFWLSPNWLRESYRIKSFFRVGIWNLLAIKESSTSYGLPLLLCFEVQYNAIIRNVKLKCNTKEFHIIFPRRVQIRSKLDWIKLGRQCHWTEKIWYGQTALKN